MHLLFLRIWLSPPTNPPQTHPRLSSVSRNFSGGNVPFLSARDNSACCVNQEWWFICLFRSFGDQGTEEFVNPDLPWEFEDMPILSFALSVASVLTIIFFSKKQINKTTLKWKWANMLVSMGHCAALPRWGLAPLMRDLSTLTCTDCRLGFLDLSVFTQASVLFPSVLTFIPV